MTDTGPLPPVCVLAGGRGTRLGQLTTATPKALIEVAGRPFIHHQLDLLAGFGADLVVICVGHLGEQIESSVGDGADFSLSVRYAYDPPGLAGTAVAIRGALDLLGAEFLTLYGDTYLRIDYRDFAAAFRRRGLPAQMAVLRNEGRWDASNTEVADGLVVRHGKSAQRCAWIDYGLGAFRVEVFDSGPGAIAADLSEVYAELAAQRRLGAYQANNRFYEIGTPEALAEADRFLRSAELG